MMSPTKIAQLLRIHQWAKNGFLFFPLFFSGNVLNSVLQIRVLFGFVSFCMLASGFYIINDVLDRKEDERHPRKASRPIASGQISVPLAIGMSVVLVWLGFVSAYILGDQFFLVALLYTLLQAFYNCFAKKAVLWDVIFLAFGFLLRIWAGGAAAETAPSFWLLMCVFVLALFLGFTKRRHELSLMKGDAQHHREVLKHYNIYFLDQVILLSAILAIIFYSLYTISPELVNRVGGYTMVPSVIFVIYGILRYLYLAHVKNMGGDPSEMLIKDSSLLLTVICWIGFIFFILYSVSKTFV